MASVPHVTIGRSVFHTLRFELVFVMLCGVILPASLAVGVGPVRLIPLLGLDQNATESVTTYNSFICAALSALGTAVVLRRFRLYPGTAVAGSIFPVLASFYGAALAIILFLRAEYSNQILLFCFFATLAARYAIETLHIRVSGLFYWIVPGGKVDVIRQLERTPTATLSSTSVEDIPAGAIIADLHADLAPEWERFIAEAAISGRGIYHYKQAWEAETGKVQINHLSENGFGSLVPSIAYQKIKRLVDLCFCVLAFPIALPLLAICAAAIKVDGGGSVLFFQRRMGFRGQPFKVVKFRTMTETHNDGDRQESITQNDDARITRVGKFLRKSRLDELPQIYNILLGQMSWIGPRPEAVSLSSWYEAEIPFYRYRHIVRPGITGWAQVNQGHVASLDEVTEKLQFDFYYIKNLSYWLDIVIALRTLRVVLSGFGAK
nr:sugar transferase [Allopontixanthobacter confluentis]